MFTAEPLILRLLEAELPVCHFLALPGNENLKTLIAKTMSITSKEELLAMQKVIDSLIDKGELTPDEQDYLNVLGTLVYEYEEKHKSIPDIYGVELLKALIAEFG